MQHSDKIAVVTGAAQGIGLAIAQKLSAEGARVVLADINSERGEAEAKLIKNAAFVHCDVGDEESAKQLIAHTVKEYGRIDLCVNNAAIVPMGTIFDVGVDNLDAALRINLRGAFIIAREAARNMVEQGSGAIVNLSSVSASLASPGMIAYGMSKAGINMLTKALALTLAPHAIRVNAVAPGTVNTAAATELMANPAMAETVLSRTPLGRLADPAEIADVVSYLLSDQATYITGETIFVDGGRVGMNYAMPKKA